MTSLWGLQKEKIKELKKELFSDCKNSLEDINFSFNEIDKLPEDLFKECKKLQYIKFNNNKLPKPFNNCSDSLTDASSYDSIFYRKVFEANIKYRQLNCLEFCIYKKLTDLCNCSYPTINEVDGRESCLRKDYLSIK